MDEVTDSKTLLYSSSAVKFSERKSSRKKVRVIPIRDKIF